MTRLVYKNSVLQEVSVEKSSRQHTPHQCLLLSKILKGKISNCWVVSMIEANHWVYKTVSVQVWKLSPHCLESILKICMRLLCRHSHKCLKLSYDKIQSYIVGHINKDSTVIINIIQCSPLKVNSLGPEKWVHFIQCSL